MDNTIFDELFAALRAMPLSAAELARLRAWLSGMNDQAGCNTLPDRRLP